MHPKDQTRTLMLDKLELTFLLKHSMVMITVALLLLTFSQKISPRRLAFLAMIKMHSALTIYLRGTKRAYFSEMYLDEVPGTKLISLLALLIRISVLLSLSSLEKRMVLENPP
jgi:surface polysaccharide O-acyltransferase-like enzyme